METVFRHWRRIAVTLIPLAFALLHVAGVLPIGVIPRLENIIYDARLRATMPNTLDERIVIVDIDEKSLAEVGRWPWGRNKLADLVRELLDEQKVALLGFDVVFAEPDESSGLQRLRQLAQVELRDQAGFAARLAQLQDKLDYDAAFARAIKNRPVVLGYYLTSDSDGRVSGALPPPAMAADALQGRPIKFTSWNGFGANIETIARAAPAGGFFNSITEGDGVVRSIPLLAEFRGLYYESLSLAMFRALVGQPAIEPGFPPEKFLSRSYTGLDSILLRQGGKTLAIPVDDRVATLVPFRGRGGVKGGSFRYVSAADVVSRRLTPGALKDKIVLLGTTAPGLLDLRVTPVGETYPGVETHANVLSGLLDGKVLVRPDYSTGFEVLTLLISGLGLAFVLPRLSAPKAVFTSVGVISGLVVLNLWLHQGYGLVLPLASALVMAITAFALNMSYGYFVESKSKRELAGLFGSYVPPELVSEMVKNPESYSMTASTKELTVLFCDMRGFTHMSETMEPTQLQELLNRVFSRLTEQIRKHRGTIDKYMGDCVMAFWGAPIDTPEHATLAVRTALEMTAAVRQLNIEHRARGVPEIAIGIGVNTGRMCVGDMGSDIRRSYTVIGDAVNLGSRLEGLCKTYGVDMVVSESTRKLVSDVGWQELDTVKVKGKDKMVAIFTPMAPLIEFNENMIAELRSWDLALAAYRSQDWEQFDAQMGNLRQLSPDKYLYQLYAERVASLRLLPFNAEWDGSTSFQSK